MKKLLLSVLLLGAVGAYAQPKSVLVYGELGINSAKTQTDDKYFGFRFNPGIGYQFDRNWTLGLTGSFGTNRQRSSIAREWDFTNTYSAGVFVRHTLPVSKIFFFFTQLESGYIGSALGNTGTNTTVNTNGFYASLTPAVGIFIAQGFALNFGFGGINYHTFKFSGATKSNSAFDLTWGSQFNIAVSKNLFCGQKSHKKYRSRRHHGQGPLNYGSKVLREKDDDVEVED